VNKPYNVGDTFEATADLIEDAAKKSEEDTSVYVSDKGVKVSIPGGSAEAGDKGVSVAYGGGEVSADNKGVKIKTPFGDIKISKQDDPFGKKEDGGICTIM
jgi:hypothetical protein